MSRHNSIWWGPPKKFSAQVAERKISWLELFYDLVYVIVISRTTHMLVQHMSPAGIIDYVALFSLIFWGWFNGSQYHDLHGSPGVRTRFMTLWQMIAVASLAVSLNSPPDKMLFRTTVSIAFLQAYITYLWWSVGIYDKGHRKLNIPYTICYLLSLGLIIGSLYMPRSYSRIMFWLALMFNYLPPFIVFKGARGQAFTLSSSMVERLGLMVIIVFGEAILGVINGMDMPQDTTVIQWLCFGLGILIVFALWWIFFAIIADRESKPGYTAGMFMAMIYIPVISSLGMIGAYFPGLMKDPFPEHFYGTSPRMMFGGSIVVFLCCITALSRFLTYPHEYKGAQNTLTPMLLITAVMVAMFTFIYYATPLPLYLLVVFVLLLVLVVAITAMWYRVEKSKE